MAEYPHSTLSGQEYRLPTLLIVPLVQIIVAVFLFFALLTGQHDLTVLSLVIFTLLMGTRIWSRLSAAKFQHDTKLDKQRGFPGETFTFSTRVRNAKILPVLARLSISYSRYFQPAEDQSALEKSCSLLWFQETGFKWHLNALQRGVYRLGLADLRVGDLFGFYSRRPDTVSPMEVIVYPRLIPLKPVPLLKRDLFGLPGAKSPIADPIYVYGTRDYQSGRPARYIHWKASARLSRLQEKISEPATQEKILLIIDVDGFLQHQAHSDMEKILEVAASAAVQFDLAGFAVGLAINGELNGGGSAVLPIGRGAQQIPAILETMARIQMRPAGKMKDILRRGLSLPWGTTGVSFTYDSGESCKEISSFFNHRRAPTVSIVCRLNSTSASDERLVPGDVITLQDICAEAVSEVGGSISLAGEEPLDKD
jgi:uncharacterized protein (DUF58 family)